MSPRDAASVATAPERRSWMSVPTENLIPTMYIGLVEDLASAC